MFGLLSRRVYCVLSCLLLSLTVRGVDPLLSDLGLDSAAAREVDQNKYTPAPPPSNPAQHASAEGMPPLPLPAVSLRRTEKKNPPRPPVLIAKLASKKSHDWATNPADTKNLLKWMAKNLRVSFSEMNMPEDQIPSDPKGVPVLYKTGVKGFEFTPEQRKRLGEYLRGGGTLIMAAVCGSTAFAESAVAEARKLLPERAPHRLSKEHPLFHTYFDISEFKYRPQAIKAGARNGDPGVIGVELGCRTAILVFRWDISCGWDEQLDNSQMKCMGYDINVSKQIGANLMSYITSERAVALPLSQAMAFVDESKARAGKFTIAQVKYNGIWKTREAGISMLLNYFHEQTKTPVTFDREEVALTSNHLFDLPLVYMTGHDFFQFTPAERANLQRYLNQGGVLFAESCCGRTDFTASFTHEMRQLFPSATLERLPAGHIIYRYPNNITDVQPDPALAVRLKTKGRVAPELYGISIDGHLAVIFSPYGLSCGWELATCPYCGGIHSRDALTLGINVLNYALLQ
ncbi:MAG: DUF4159 domain-containing protein [Victivallales bacterium]|nr:DUF4159 domain-containing protein [Victivallales bacterium]